MVNLLKFINLFFEIKSLFSCLPKGLQEEIIEDMEGYLGLCRIAKVEKTRKEIINECSRQNNRN